MADGEIRMTLRVPPDIYNDLVQRADMQHRSLNSQIVYELCHPSEIVRDSNGDWQLTTRKSA